MINEPELFEKALKAFGWDAQVDMLIEEMAELTQALLKYRRKENHDTFDHICEEFSDVIIVMKQIRCGLHDAQLDKWHNLKINRLQQLVLTHTELELKEK